MALLQSCCIALRTQRTIYSNACPQFGMKTIITSTTFFSAWWDFFILKKIVCEDVRMSVCVCCNISTDPSVHINSYTIEILDRKGRVMAFSCDQIKRWYILGVSSGSIMTKQEEIHYLISPDILRHKLCSYIGIGPSSLSYDPQNKVGACAFVCSFPQSNFDTLETGSRFSSRLPRR